MTRDIALLPKAHLHVHLESTVRLDEEAPVFQGFRDFADYNARIREGLRTAADFKQAAFEYCEDEAVQGTRYAEVTFTAASHGERLGGPPEMPLEAVLEGLAEGQSAYGIECRVLLDHSRRRSVERAWLTLDLAKRYASYGVVALGVAGEESYPLAPFAEVFDAAKSAGLHVVHHAGESCGPESIREAIELGGAERLGHGIRVLDDDDLVATVRERAIPLEVCPSSNVALGFADSIAAHPLPALREAGLVVTVNTDIPNVIGTSLAEEYARIRDAFGYDDTVLADLARASIGASFAPEATKARVHREIDAWLAA